VFGTLVLVLCAIIPSITLALSGVLHLISFTRFVDTLRSQRVFPSQVAPVIALIVSVTELVVGFGALLTVVNLSAFGVSKLLMLTGVLAVLAGFSGYLVLLRLRRPGVPCGCGASESAVTRGHLARNCVLVGMGGLATAFAYGSLVFPPSPTRLVPTFLMAGALSLILWHLPDALRAPDATQSEGFYEF
jgi:hypothetical protein